MSPAILDEEPKRRNSVVIQGLWDFMALVDAGCLVRHAGSGESQSRAPGTTADGRARHR